MPNEPNTRSLEERFEADVASVRSSLAKRGHRLCGYALVAVVDDGSSHIQPQWALERHESRAFDEEIHFGLDEVQKLFDAE